MTEHTAETDDGVERFSAAGIDALRRIGPGPRLVLLHGIGSRAESFLPLLPHLSPEFDVVMWNAPGYGGSVPLANAWPVEDDYADALAAFLDALGFDQIHLLGHSLGTLMAARFAVRHPGRLASLTLAACASGYGVTPGNALPEKVQARIDALTELGGPEFARTRAPRLVFEPDTHPDAVAAVERGMAAVQMPGYGQAVRMLASGRLNESLGRVTAPTTFLWAEGDVVTPEAQTLDAIAARRSAGGPEPDHHRIPDAGHAFYLEKPAAFAGRVNQAVAAGSEFNGGRND